MTAPDPSAWIGRSERREDVIRPFPAEALAATLDLAAAPGPGDLLPLGWHWLYFLEARPRRELGRDGHPAKGGFLPPVDLPRRMWAGGRLERHGPLRIGEAARRLSTVTAVTAKQGRSGRLAFVTVRHEISGPAGLAIVEEHDIVYREDGAPAAPTTPAPADAVWREVVEPDATMLFRYSALTFNGHRIHYDAAYARTVEGYDGLVLHGPLMATLLLGLAGRHGEVARFSFRGTAPVTVGAGAITACGRPQAGGAALWVARADGALAMTAQAHFASP